MYDSEIIKVIHFYKPSGCKFYDITSSVVMYSVIAIHCNNSKGICGKKLNL